jgi:hypothetical protein
MRAGIGHGPVWWGAAASTVDAELFQAFVVDGLPLGAEAERRSPEHL